MSSNDDRFDSDDFLDAGEAFESDAFGAEPLESYVSPGSKPRGQRGPARTSRRKSSSLFIGGVVVISLFSVALIGGVVFVLNSKLNPSDVRVTRIRSRGQLRAEAAEVFGTLLYREGDPVQQTPAQYDDQETIEPFLAQLSRSVADVDATAFLNLVDFDRYQKRIELTGALSEWTRFDRLGLKAQLREVTISEPHWFRLVVIDALTPVDDPDSRIIYAHGWDDEENQTELRLWIGRTETGWALYDWERLDLGLTESRDWEVVLRYSDGLHFDNYQLWQKHVYDAQMAMLDGDRESAGDALRRAETVLLPSERTDCCLLQVAYEWQSVNDYESAQRCFERVDPEVCPGAWFGLLFCVSYSDPERALEYAKRYEAALGPSVQLNLEKARLLDRLQRPEEALLAWKQVARLQPDHLIALSGILIALPGESKHEIEPWLSAADQPVSLASELAAQVAYRDVPAMSFLVEYARNKAPDAPATLAAIGLEAEMDGKFVEAAGFYSRAMNAEKDEAARNGHMRSFLDAQVQCDRIIEGYHAAPDQQSAFDYLTNAWDEGDLEISPDEFSRLLDVHLKRHPGDLLGVYYAVDLAIEAEDYQTAESLLDKALASDAARENPETSEDDDEYSDNEYALEMLLSQRVTVLFWTDRLAAALSVSEDAFAELGQLCVANERWAELRDLLARSAPTHSDKPGFHRLKGELARSESRWSNAYDHFLKASELAEGPAWTFRIAELAIKSNRWKNYLATADDAQAAFDALANAAIEQRQWKLLDQLIEAAREDKTILELSFLRFEAAAAAWERRDYSSCASSSRVALELVTDSSTNWRDRNLAVLRIRSLLRLERYDDAESEAAAFAQRFDRTELPVIAAAGRGDLDRALKLALDEDVPSYSLYADNVESGELFLSENFQPLLKKEPVGDLGELETVAIFALQSSLSLDADTVQSAIRETGSSSGLPPTVKSFDDENGAVFVVEAGRGTIWCRVGTGRFRPDWTLKRLPAEVAVEVDQSVGYLTIGVGGLTAESRDSVRSLARKIGHRLASGKTNVFTTLPDGSYLWSWLLLRFDDPGMSEWIETGSVSSFHTQGRQLFQRAPESDVVGNRHFDQELQKVLRQFDTPATTPLRVQLHVSNVDCVEALWVDVLKVERSYGFSIQGRLKNSSKLIPALRRDLPVSASSYGVQSWRSGTAEPVGRP